MTREFRVFEYVDGDKKVYFRFKGEDDSQWKELGMVLFGDRRSTRNLAAYFGLTELTEVENQLLTDELAFPRRW